MPSPSQATSCPVHSLPSVGTPERAAGKRRGQRPPRIKALPIIGPVREFTGDVVPFITETRKKYGDAFRFQLFGMDLTCIGGDDAIALLRNDDLLSTHKSMVVLEQALQSRLPMTFDGPQHPMYRKMHMQFLNRRLEHAKRDTIIASVAHCCDDWRAGETLELLQQSQLQTVHILSRILNAEELPFSYKDLSLVVHTIIMATYGHIPMWLALNNPRYKAVQKRMSAHFLDLVRRVRQDPELAQNTLIGQYLASPPPTGCDEWDDNDLKIVPLIAYVAGFDTVASAAAFFLYRLLANPNWLRRVREEYRTLARDENGHVDPNQQHVLHAAFQETVRLNPPGALVIRHATCDFDFKGYRIRRGDEVFVQISSDHLNEQLFPNPHTYDPSRWLSDDATGLGTHVRTFGAGAHRCTGRVLGPLIAQEMVSYWVNHFDLELQPRNAKPRVMAIPFTQPLGLKVRVIGRREP